MLNRNDLYTSFIRRMTIWGLKLGALLGFAFVPVYLLILLFLDPFYEFTLSTLFSMFPISLFYGLFGALIGAIVGTGMGLVLGLLLALLTRLFFFTTRNREQYVTLIVISSTLLGFFTGILGFVLVGEVLGDLFRESVFIGVPSIIASGASVFAARRVARWYVEANREVA